MPLNFVNDVATGMLEMGLLVRLFPGPRPAPRL